MAAEQDRMLQEQLCTFSKARIPKNAPKQSRSARRRAAQHFGLSIARAKSSAKGGNLAAAYSHLTRAYQSAQLLNDRQRLSACDGMLQLVVKNDIFYFRHHNPLVEIQAIARHYLQQPAYDTVLGLSRYFSERYRGVLLVSQIAELLPAEEKDFYPAARHPRHFILHAGGTNTGKTYQSLCALQKARSGVYLGPLRLLAMEVQDRMLEEGVCCSLLTGEERDLRPQATVTASTVEMLDPNTHYDIAVVDESQMIYDAERGFAWTRAIMGLDADTIHLCCAEYALPDLLHLIEYCCNTAEVIHHQRRVPLLFCDRDFDCFSADMDHSAYIFFSRKEVLGFAAMLEERGVHASVVYGALPYKTRKEQVRRFVEGQTRVVVATDAIGMGLNLPIQSTVFMRTEKYDGTATRPLYTQEIKQIAARAGRQGIYDVGYVFAASDRELIAAALTCPDSTQGCSISIGFPEKLLSLPFPLREIILAWAEVESPFPKMRIDRYIYLLDLLAENDLHPAGNRLLFSLVDIGFDEKSEPVKVLWLTLCRQYLQTGEVDSPVSAVLTDIRGKAELTTLEMDCRLLDAYFAFCQKLSLTIDERIETARDALAQAINAILISQMRTQGRRCRLCGRAISWDSPYGICDRCWQHRTIRRH